MTAPYVHESSYADEGVAIGEGTRIWHFCHIQSGASIGRGCSLGQNVYVGDARVDTVFQRGVLRAKIPELHHLPSTSDTMDSYSRSISSSRSLGILRWRMVPPEAMNSCGSSSFSNALTSMSTSVL